MNKRGFLLTIEGIDGAGKSTLLVAIADYLKKQSFNVIVTREPGGTLFGQGLREMLQHASERPCHEAEFLLFAADRAQHIKTVVKPALELGAIVISDRMADSSMAYQGYGRGVDCAMIATVNTWVMDGIAPDLVLYVRLDWKTAFYRICQGRKELTAFEQEKKDFFERVIDGFDSLYKDNRAVCVLDGSLEQGVIAEQAINVVMHYLQGV